MDLNGLNSAISMVVGVFALIGIANLLDYSFQNHARNKAERAEFARLLRWGLGQDETKRESRF